MVEAEPLLGLSKLPNQQRLRTARVNLLSDKNLIAVEQELAPRRPICQVALQQSMQFSDTFYAETLTQDRFNAELGLLSIVIDVYLS